MDGGPFTNLRQPLVAQADEIGVPTCIELAALTALVLAALPLATLAQGDGGYRLVPNWPTLPAGMFFGLKDAPPPPAEREAQAAARRAQGGQQRGRHDQRRRPTNQPGISGLAISQQDLIYVFNRGPKPVMVFDTEGTMVMAGADQEINGKTINPSWQHSGTVDWDGNVYIIERDAHRIVKLSPKMDKFLMQLGTTGEKGTDAKHFDLPSGIAVLKNGNIIVTDGYGNNRVLLFDKDGTLLKQVGKGAGGPADKGTGNGEWVSRTSSPWTRRRTSTSSTARTSGCRCSTRTSSTFARSRTRAGIPGTSASRARAPTASPTSPTTLLERVHKMQLSDGKLVATWGSQGLGPGQFDWVHGIVVDSQGAVYAADTYGQRLQKFVQASGSR